MEPEQNLTDFLVQEWSTGLRITTIPQAMQRLGLADELDLRWQVAGRVEKLWRQVLLSPEKRQQIDLALGRTVDEAQIERWREQVNTWHLASVLLTEEEKLVARFILLRRSRGAPYPRPAEIANALVLPVHQVNDALLMLGRLGFLALKDQRPALYALVQGRERFLDGLGFSFHTVTLRHSAGQSPDTGEQFGVPWAVDFLLLVSSQYQSNKLTLDDACAHCVDRIHIEVDRGRLVQVTPEETIVYQGGTWGQNNLFWSEEHLRGWGHGDLPQAGRWMTVRQFLKSPAWGSPGPFIGDSDGNPRALALTLEQVSTTIM